MVARGLRARAILIAVIGNPDTEYRTIWVSLITWSAGWERVAGKLADGRLFRGECKVVLLDILGNGRVAFSKISLPE